jgi:hypothetical protein
MMNRQDARWFIALSPGRRREEIPTNPHFISLIGEDRMGMNWE